MKYCGGCRAGYDRVELVDSIRDRLGGIVEFVDADSEDAQIILIVSGCSTACTKLDGKIDRPTRYIKSPEDAERWIEEMRVKLKRSKR